MSALLAPLLAQLVTVGVVDRTEARYYEPSPYRYEGATRPAVRLQLAWPRYNVTFGYGATLTLVPLESKPRDLLVYQLASVSQAYTYKRTSVSLTTSGAWGEVNFRTQALGATAATRAPAPGPGEGVTPATPTAPSPTPANPTTPTNPTGMSTVTPGGQLQRTVVEGPVRYGTLTNSLTVAQQITKPLRLAALGTHTIAGGLDEGARESYPYIRGTTVGLNGVYLYLLSTRDAFSTNVTLQHAWSTLGTRVTSLLATESWNHRFDKQTFGTLSAGMSASRTPFGDYSAYSVFPTLGAFLNHSRKLARGTWVIAVGGYSAPSLDPLRATVDPRLGVYGNTGWARDRFSARLGASVAVSIADSGNNAGAFNSTSANAGISYRLSKWVQADAGATVAEQAYQDQTTIPLSYVAFLGVTFGYEAPIAGRKR